MVGEDDFARGSNDGCWTCPGFDQRPVVMIAFAGGGMLGRLLGDVSRDAYNSPFSVCIFEDPQGRFEMDLHSVRSCHAITNGRSSPGGHDLLKEREGSRAVVGRDDLEKAQTDIGASAPAEDRLALTKTTRPSVATSTTMSAACLRSSASRPSFAIFSVGMGGLSRRSWGAALRAIPRVALCGGYLDPPALTT